VRELQALMEERSFWAETMRAFLCECTPNLGLCPSGRKKQSGSSRQLFEPGYDGRQRYVNLLSTSKTAGGNAYTLTRLHPRKPYRLQNM